MGQWQLFMRFTMGGFVGGDFEICVDMKTHRALANDLEWIFWNVFQNSLRDIPFCGT